MAAGPELRQPSVYDTYVFQQRNKISFAGMRLKGMNELVGRDVAGKKGYPSVY